MKRAIVLVFCMVSVVTTWAQPDPEVLWSRTYGLSWEDKAYYIDQTSDGGYIVAGMQKACSGCSETAYLIKLNSLGDTTWARWYLGGLGLNARSVQQTSDGGFVAAGYIYISGSYQDFGLLKTDNLGNQTWLRNYGSGSSDEAYSVQQTTDGGYIVAGYTFGPSDEFQQFYVVKTNSNGDTVWTRRFGGNGNEVARSVRQTTDGGYIIAGWTTSFGAGGFDYYLVKTDSQGDTLWTRTFGGSSTDQAHSVRQTADGGYIAAGRSWVSGYGYQCCVAKMSSLGELLWTKYYGLYGEEAHSIQQTPDGGYAIAGHTMSFGAGSNDFYLVRTNTVGDLLWARTYGGSASDQAYSIVRTADGGYILAGITDSFGAGSSDFYVVKTGPERGIFVLSPNGGEEWRILQNDTIRWIGTGFAGRIRIEMQRDYPHGEWEVLVDSTENDGEEIATVTDPLSEHCRVRVSAIEDTLHDISDGDFAITSSQGYLALVRTSQPNSPVISWNGGILECSAASSETFRLKNFGIENIDFLPPSELVAPEFMRTTDCAGNIALAPGQMSACTVAITFDPETDGTHFDTLLIQTDAINGVGGYVRIPLSGSQISTPVNPDIVITTEGGNARLSWDPVTVSIGDCPIAVAHYLVFYSPTLEGPYYYHGFTPDTTYLHYGVVHYEYGMFYHGIATTSGLPTLLSLPADGTVEKSTVIARLRKQ